MLWILGSLAVRQRQVADAFGPVFCLVARPALIHPFGPGWARCCCSLPRLESATRASAVSTQAARPGGHPWEQTPSSWARTLLRAWHTDEGCSRNRLEAAAGEGRRVRLACESVNGEAAARTPPPPFHSPSPGPAAELRTSELLASMLASVTHVRASSLPRLLRGGRGGRLFLNEKSNGIFIILLINQAIRATCCCSAAAASGTFTTTGDLSFASSFSFPLFFTPHFPGTARTHRGTHREWIPRSICGPDWAFLQGRARPPLPPPLKGPRCVKAFGSSFPAHSGAKPHAVS